MGMRRDPAGDRIRFFVEGQKYTSVPTVARCRSRATKEDFPRGLGGKTFITTSRVRGTASRQTFEKEPISWSLGGPGLKPVCARIVGDNLYLSTPANLHPGIAPTSANAHRFINTGTAPKDDTTAGQRYTLRGLCGYPAMPRLRTRVAPLLLLHVSGVRHTMDTRVPRYGVSREKRPESYFWPGVQENESSIHKRGHDWVDPSVPGYAGTRVPGYPRSRIFF
eukprot:3435269-Rhodomonas_salina.1